MQANQTNVYVNNCQTVVIGNHNDISQESSPVQENRPAKVDEENRKIRSVYPDKPFHVSRTRKKELNEIESLFSAMPEDEDVVKTVYLVGQPGSGKTELARQYGEKFNKERSLNNTSKALVITLKGNLEEALFKSLNKARQHIRLPICMKQTTPNLNFLIEEIKDHFRRYGGAWLLIIDDMFENSFNHLFPRPGAKEWGSGQVLVTTQDNNLVPAFHQFAQKLSLSKGMVEEDALALLKEISNIEVDGYVEEVMEELQNLPLALACCATYVAETREDRASTQFGWKEYLQLYRENSKLESRTFFKNNDVYPLSMTTATKMAVERMAGKSDVLRLTFSFLSYCPLLPVPLNVLAHHVQKNLPIRGDKLSTTYKNEILQIENEISRCVLLSRGQSQNVETITCHQVIHSSFQGVENTKSSELRENEFVKMMKSLNEVLDFMDNTKREDVLLKVLLRPHVRTFVDFAHEMAWNNSAEFVLISMKDGQFLFSTSEMSEEEAAKSLELLYDISLELNLPDEHLCDVLANLGFYYLELDRGEEALNFLCKAYDMTQGKTEKEWLLLKCRISYNLARTYCRADSVDRGIEMMKESILLAKEVYVNEEDKVMNIFMWLASFYFSGLRFWKLANVVAEAREFLNSCPADSVSVNRARSLTELAIVYVYSSLCFWRKNGLLAVNLIKESLSIYEQVLGAHASSCPNYCSLLALFSVINLLMEGETPEAKRQLEKALKYCTQIDDKLSQSMLVASRRHLTNLSGFHGWLVWIRNLTRGRVFFAKEMNIVDDILEDSYSKRISASRRILNGMKTAKRIVVTLNYCYIFLFLYLFYGFVVS